MPVKPAKKPATKPSAKPSKAIVPVKPKPLSTNLAEELARDAGVGTENFGRDDLQIPRITILQDMSDQVKKKQPAYIEGAEPGMICDLVNARIFDGDEGIVVLPFAYRRTHLEWKPNRGGFVADHGPDGKILEETTKDDQGRNILKNKNIINVHAEYFVFLLEDDGKFSPFVISMAGTQLKHSRRWNTMINQQRVPVPGGDAPAPMFYRSYRLTTQPESNDKGSWFAWSIAPDKAVTDEEFQNGIDIYRAAKQFRTSVAEGKVKAAPPTEQTPSAEDESAAM
jgi:hypothetical protein